MPLFGVATVNSTILNDFVTNVVMNISKVCAAKAINKIEIGAKSVAGNVVIGGEIIQNASADLRCEQLSDLSAAIKSEMANTIKQSASSKDNSLLSGDFGVFSATSAENYTANTNLVNTKLDDVVECVAEATNEFKAIYGSVGGDFTFAPTKMEQNTKANISKCVQNTKYIQDITSSVDNDLDQEAKNVGTLDALFGEVGRILASLSTLLIVMAVMSGIVYIAKAYFDSKKKYMIDAAGDVKDAVAATVQDGALAGKEIVVALSEKAAEAARQAGEAAAAAATKSNI